MDIKLEKMNQNLKEVIVHELGHLIVSTVMSEKWEDYKIQSFHINCVCGKYSGKVLAKHHSYSNLKEVVESNEDDVINYTIIDYLFGSFMQGMYVFKAWEEEILKKTNGRCDYGQFKEICKLLNTDEYDLIEFEFFTAHFDNFRKCLFENRKFNDIIISIWNDTKQGTETLIFIEDNLEKLINDLKEVLDLTDIRNLFQEMKFPNF